MKLVEILTPDFTFTDERGTLTQLVHGGYSQVNAVFTKAGKIRGNFHRHENTKEAFYIIKGKIRLIVKLGDITEEYTFSDGSMFLIPENVNHTFFYEEDTFLTVLYTNPVEKEDGTKDIISDGDTL